jgi:hypothetical protein
MNDQALPMKTINTSSGNPYISIIDSGETFSIQIHRYEKELGRVLVTLDKCVIPEMIEHLKELKYEQTN